MDGKTLTDQAVMSDSNRTLGQDGTGTGQPLASPPAEILARHLSVISLSLYVAKFIVLTLFGRFSMV